jgi:ribonuclease BN (tRNA processing enzyme)
MLFSIELPRSASSSYRPFISLQSVPVTHCPQAFAIILGIGVPDDENPFFLVYSGDTRPSQSLVQACQRVLAVGNNGSRIDILIHETTFDDDEQGKRNAIAKRHSTVMEAVEIARQMEARCCLFTHFSQRYPNLPDSATSRASGPFPRQDKLKVCAAIDGMIIPLREAADSMPLLNQCCQKIVN